MPTMERETLERVVFIVALLALAPLYAAAVWFGN
jgi:hypothetical protein